MFMKKCNFHVRGIKSIRPYITKRVCNSLIIALVVSNLNYCNAILLDIPRFTVRVPKYASFTPVLRDLHTGTCSIQGLGSGPQGCQKLWANVYVRPCLAPQAYQVRPRTRYKVGDANFVAAAPDLWNDLPVSLRELTSEATFKRTLKHSILTNILTDRKTCITI